jgi:hypothetical protein
MATCSSRGTMKADIHSSKIQNSQSVLRLTNNYYFCGSISPVKLFGGMSNNI